MGKCSAAGKAVSLASRRLLRRPPKKKLLQFTATCLNSHLEPPFAGFYFLQLGVESTSEQREEKRARLPDGCVPSHRSCRKSICSLKRDPPEIDIISYIRWKRYFSHFHFNREPFLEKVERYKRPRQKLELLAASKPETPQLR